MKGGQGRSSAGGENGANDAGQLLTVVEAAAYLRCSKSYLDKLRVYGGGPPFLRIGTRKVLYRRTAIEAWAASRTYSSTSAYPLRPARAAGS